MHLPIGTELQNGKYRIDDKIGQGGFGITYKGVLFTNVQQSLGSIKVQVPIAIKEFFFQDYCNRDEPTHHVSISSATGKEMFSRFKYKLIKEASLLAQFNHKNIVDVLDVFEENGTAYMIMEYIDGDSLKDVIEKKKILPVEIAVQYICDISEALKQIHQKNILHLDIKPSNIMILKDGSAKLLDFGVSKHYSGSNHIETSTTPVGLSRGYAPPEQYLSDGVKSFLPATDIYSLGATLYHCVTGVMPIEANQRIEEDLVLPHVLNTLVTETLESSILKAMALRRADRYQNIDTFLEGLLNSEGIAKEPNIPGERLAETILINKKEEEPISPEDSIISKATNVDDTMDYQTAFNAARNEIGSIGYFEWHKQLFTTSSPEEYRKWDYRTKFRMQEIIAAFKDQNKNQDSIKLTKTEINATSKKNIVPWIIVLLIAVLGFSYLMYRYFAYEEKGYERDGLTLVRNHNLYGYIDTEGKEVIQCQYLNAHEFSDSLAFVETKDNKKGFINVNGELVIDLSEYGMSLSGGFLNGISAIDTYRTLPGESDQNADFYYGAINKTGKMILPIICKKMDYNSDMNKMVFQYGDTWIWVLNSDGLLTDSTSSKYYLEERDGSISYTYVSDAIQQILND